MSDRRVADGIGDGAESLRSLRDEVQDMLATPKISRRRRGGCTHTDAPSFSVAGMRADRCRRCGKVSISYVETARTGVLFWIPRDGFTTETI